MNMIHIMDVTNPKDPYTLYLVSTKQDALVFGRQFIEDEKRKGGELKVEIYDGLRRFKNIKLQ